MQKSIAEALLSSLNWREWTLISMGNGLYSHHIKVVYEHQNGNTLTIWKQRNNYKVWSIDYMDI